MPSNAPVGILDSGVGGMTVVRPFAKKLPREGVVYIGDSLNMPYGNKGPDEIARLAGSMIGFLEGKGAKAILLACNTISSEIKRLESKARLISIIEAGAAAAAGLPRNASVGLIATRATEKSGMYQKEIARLRPDLKIVSSSSSSLPKIIDSQLENRALLHVHIRAIVDPIFAQDAGVAHILLGCSHFPIIKGELEAIYPQASFIDPADAMVEILASYLKEEGLESGRGEAGRLDMYTTAETFEYAAAIRRLKLEIDSLVKVRLP
jgi:glutamate racemase